jgi:hypothetical protein
MPSWRTPAWDRSSPRWSWRSQLIVMPRRAELGEHRNDHQLSTARHMLAQNVISVAKDEIELMHQLDQIKEVGAARPIPAYASGELIETISSFLAACGKR